MECSPEHNESGVSPVYVRRHHSGRSPQSRPQVSVTGWHYNEYAGLSMLYITNRRNSAYYHSLMGAEWQVHVPALFHVFYMFVGKHIKFETDLIKSSPKEAAGTNWAFDKVLHMIQLTGHLVWFILRPMRLNTESLHSHAPTLAARGELHFNELLILVCVPVIITDLMNIYVSCLKFRDVRKRTGMLWRS